MPSSIWANKNIKRIKKKSFDFRSLIYMKIGNHLARCLSLQNLSLFKNGPIGFDWGDNVAINFFCVETWKERKLKFSHMTLVAIYKGGFKQIRDLKNGNLGKNLSPNALDTCKSMATTSTKPVCIGNKCQKMKACELYYFKWHQYNSMVAR